MNRSNENRIIATHNNYRAVKSAQAMNNTQNTDHGIDLDLPVDSIVVKQETRDEWIFILTPREFNVMFNGESAYSDEYAYECDIYKNDGQNGLKSDIRYMLLVNVHGLNYGRINWTLSMLWMCAAPQRKLLKFDCKNLFKLKKKRKKKRKNKGKIARAFESKLQQKVLAEYSFEYMKLVELVQTVIKRHPKSYNAWKAKKERRAERLKRFGLKPKKRRLFI